MGLAPDGGLFVPERLPKIEALETLAEAGFPSVAMRVLASFVDGDEMSGSLPEMVEEAFNFPLSLEPVADSEAQLLALYRGPTSAFKDFGARFLAACLERLARQRGRQLTILVATSGDTGGAVAAAIHKRPGLQALVLYPDGKVSARQASQLCAFGGNVVTYRVQGDFDDCQRIIKRAFQNPGLCARYHLCSANSINIGRLLPQAAYHFWASLQVARDSAGKVNFVIPTGNLGNAVACMVARAMGAPIGRIVMACNANRSVVDYFDSGAFCPRASIATVANAMDVGNPSNMERLLHFFPGLQDDYGLNAVSFSDAEIRSAIRDAAGNHDCVLCPHTATAWLAYQRLDGICKRRPWVLAATAHPAKFESIVEPAIGRPVPLPENLARMLSHTHSAEALAPDDGALREVLEVHFGE